MSGKTAVYRSGSGKKDGNGTANIGFEAKLWLAADKLRGTMDSGEYKHTVLEQAELLCGDWPRGKWRERQSH
jgi:hypothetical protein